MSHTDSYCRISTSYFRLLWIADLYFMYSVLSFYASVLARWPEALCFQVVCLYVFPFSTAQDLRNTSRDFLQMLQTLHFDKRRNYIEIGGQSQIPVTSQDQTKCTHVKNGMKRGRDDILYPKGCEWTSQVTIFHIRLDTDLVTLIPGAHLEPIVIVSIFCAAVLKICVKHSCFRICSVYSKCLYRNFCLEGQRLCEYSIKLSFGSLQSKHYTHIYVYTYINQVYLSRTLSKSQTRALKGNWKHTLLFSVERRCTNSTLNTLLFW